MHEHHPFVVCAALGLLADKNKSRRFEALNLSLYIGYRKGNMMNPLPFFIDKLGDSQLIKLISNIPKLSLNGNFQTVVRQLIFMVTS